MYFLTHDIFCFDYNWTVLLIELLLLYEELKNKDKPLEFKLKRELLLGIVAGSTILFKQSSGLIFALIFVFYKILVVPNLKETKEYFKIVFTRLTGVMIPLILFGIYLTVNKIWGDFIDYAILGIGTFSHKIDYFWLLTQESSWFKGIVLVVPIQIFTFFIIYIISFKKKELEQKEWFKNISLMAVFEIAALAVVVPIADRTHLLIGATIPIIAFFYSIYIIIIQALKKNDKLKGVINKVLNVFSIALLFGTMIFSVYKIFTKYINNEERRTDVNHFNNLIIDKYAYSAITGMGEFMKEFEKNGSTVYILDSSAPMYNIPLDKYYKDYDMFNIGNFGAKGEDGVIEDLKKKDNVYLLVQKMEYPYTWQHPDKITKFVVENYEDIGDAGMFDVYVKKR